jgi:hypothetical protein
MLSSVFVILAAIFNACMDRLENENFHVSIWKRKSKKFWYKRESWKYAYKIGGYKVDGWHLAKSGMIVSLCLAIVFYEPLFGKFYDFLFMGILWNLTFRIFYSRIFKAYDKH